MTGGAKRGGKRMRQGTLNGLAGIPEGRDAKRGRATLAGAWDVDTAGLMVFTPTAWGGVAEGRARVAAFDMDSTVISTKTKAKFPKSSSDWRLLSARIAPKFRELREAGFVLAILSNQGGVGNGRIDEEFVKERVEGVLGALEVPIAVLAATRKDRFRKPDTGMWDRLVEILGGRDKVDLDASFFVGDAAGRAARPGRVKDFSDSDLRLAINAGLAFHTPEQYFDGKDDEAVSTSDIPGFDPRTLLRDPEAVVTITAETDMDALLRRLLSPPSVADAVIRGGVTADSDAPEAQSVVLIHGFPGSGKTTFSQRHLVARGYAWVNNDSLRGASKCEKLTRQALAAGTSVVVDNTNADVAARAKYIDIARKHNAAMPVISVSMDSSRELSEHLNNVRAATSDVKRVPPVAFHAYNKRAAPPSEEEGFTELGAVRFVPCFESPKERASFARLT